MDFFDGYDFAIYGTDHHITTFATVATLRTPEEVEHKEIDHHRQGCEYRRDYNWGHKKPHRHVECGENDGEEYEDICAFAVNLHFCMSIAESGNIFLV